MQGEILAIDKLEKISRIYNEMGVGTLRFEYEIFEDEQRFDVTFRHLPTQKTYNFSFDLDTPYNDFVEIIGEALKGEIRGSHWKGIAG